MAPAPDALLIGAGDLGTEIGLRLASAGYRVTALRRRADLVPAPLHGLAGDIRDGLPAAGEFPEGRGLELLVVCLTAGGRDEAAYRAVFLEGVARVLGDVRARGWTPRRALFVSSTGVCAASGFVDESTDAEPGSPTARILLAAERQFLSLLPDATTGIVVRPSGLYGPGREWFIDQVRSGAIRDPQRMTHRIHRDDAAAAIAHLLTMPAAPDELYLLTDDLPVLADTVAQFIAERCGLPWTPSTPKPEEAQTPGVTTRRLSNALLRSTGFEFTYPSFREGYTAVLQGKGLRHP